jgi:calcineurin-like phosphoesterase family protein
MNSILIKNWNARVQKEDIVFNIGDFCFKATKNTIHRGEGDLYPSQFYEKQLNGKIIFIRGGHDSNNSCKTCIRNIKIKLGGYLINLVHDPKYVNYNCHFNITGHVHSAWKCKKFTYGDKTTRAINVSVDVTNFQPQSIEEIIKRFMRFKKSKHLEEK